MVKTKQQKEAKKATRRNELVALAGVSPKLAAGAGVARVIQKAGKKGKKGGWLSIVGKVAGMAAELAPAIVPLLLAKHAPSAAAAGANTAGGGAAVAAPVSCATCTGLYECSAQKGKDGRVIGMRMKGLDYLGAINANSETAGTVLREVDLNPLSPDWAGTQAQRFATLFERYRPNKVLGLVEPSCPSTTPGQIIGFMDPDADDEFTETGRTAIQVASSHQGADISQVWGVNAAAYAFDQLTQDFYADADGSDARLVSPGTWRVLANTDMPAATPLGSMYVAWDMSFRIPQLEEFNPGGEFAVIALDDVSGVAPLGSDPWDPVDGELQAVTGFLADTCSLLTGLPVGQYYAQYVCYSGDASGGSVPTFTIQGDTNGGYTGLDGLSTITATTNPGDVGSAGQFEAIFQFKVNQVSSDYLVAGLQISFTVPGPGAATVAEGVFRLFQVNPVSGVGKRMTLKDFEKRVQDMDVKLAQLVEQMAVDRAAASSGGLPYSTALPPHLIKHKHKAAARPTAAAAASSSGSRLLP